MHRRPLGSEQTVASESLDSLMFHICLVSSVMMSGYMLRLPFVLFEEVFPQVRSIGNHIAIA